MYHCSIRFYLLGEPCEIFETIKGMPSLEHFRHEFLESDRPEEALAAEADVILAHLQNRDVRETMQALIDARDKRQTRQSVRLILLMEKNQIGLLQEFLAEVADIWILPMTEEEVRFRFFRWQQANQAEKEA